MILGCDAAGLDEDGNEVVVHAVIGDPSLDGATRRSTRSGRCSPSATRARSPSRSPCRRRNLVPKPAGAVLRGGRLPADGVADGVPDALHPARRAARATPCWCRAPAAASPPPRSCSAAPPGCGSARPAATRPSGSEALELGADEAFESGARLPSGSTPSSRPSARRRGRTRSSRCDPGGTIVIVRRDVRASPVARRADPDLLPAAARHRLDDGHPRRAAPAGAVHGRHRHAAADRPRDPDGRCRRRTRRGHRRRRLRQDRPDALGPRSRQIPLRLAFSRPPMCGGGSASGRRGMPSSA